MAKTKEQLISHYEQHLEKVKSLWSNGSERASAYIEEAENILNAVKRDGEHGLLEYWRNK